MKWLKEEVLKHAEKFSLIRAYIIWEYAVLKEL